LFQFYKFIIVLRYLLLQDIGTELIFFSTELIPSFAIIKVVLSTRRGTWIFNRIGQWGLPYDVIYQTRFYNWLMAMLPWSIANDFHEWRIQRKMWANVLGANYTKKKLKINFSLEKIK
jgi:hypothetical protein